jgi:hypothetical protein
MWNHDRDEETSDDVDLNLLLLSFRPSKPQMTHSEMTMQHHGYPLNPLLQPFHIRDPNLYLAIHTPQTKVQPHSKMTQKIMPGYQNQKWSLNSKA